MLNVGDDAPEFELTDQHGETVRLSELIKESPVIVYFYPADFSPVCTAQACGLRDSFVGIDQVNLKIVGISPSDYLKQRQKKTTHNPSPKSIPSPCKHPNSSNQQIMHPHVWIHSRIIRSRR